MTDFENEQPVRIGIAGLGYWGPNLARNVAAIPGARLHVEPRTDPPSSPTAWQGGQLSRLIGELASAST